MVATHHSPIQLLRPPGLCRAVCPIFTTPEADLGGSLLALEVSERGVNGNTSTASITGLGTATWVEADAKKDPSGPMMSSDWSDGNGALHTGRNDSAYHSYHTCRSFVWRQIDTCNSELLGKYRGSYEKKKIREILVTTRQGMYNARTRSGKNNGNQLNMSFETCSFRCGWILSPTSP